ncbi:MAG: ethanolamine ammonia-lyase subunit EutB, partial [Tabrizicola sp.]|nr:ethanolamine ammonia-lyase subunit EutB [Tabrizicola sp.]
RVRCSVASCPGPWCGSAAAIGAAIIAIDAVQKKRGSSFRVPVLAAAVGIYLPLDVTMPIFLGGILAHFVERTAGKPRDPADHERMHQDGVLYSSGLITGEALMGNAAFGIDLALLDEANALVRERGRLRTPHVWYFETGQGSELSSAAHEGVDQLTLEARCYGVARRYAPLLVNTVVGFIGPEYLYDAREIARAGLEDHFMGKLLGLPMGADVCYTNHAEADQNDLESTALQLAAAGCNYFMGVPLGDDCMLHYQSTSYHDVAALRERKRCSGRGSCGFDTRSVAFGAGGCGSSVCFSRLKA